MNRIIRDILTKLYFFPGYLINAPFFVLNKVKVPTSVEFIGKIILSNKGSIFIGERVRIRSGFKYNPIGLGYKTVLKTFSQGQLLIGNHVKMSNTCICCASKITIEDEVMIGGGVCIYDTDFHSLNPSIRMELINKKEVPATKEIHIETGVFIGAGSIILKGTTIGAYSVIGAGSVVSGKIPQNEVWAGNPAKFIRKLNEQELIYAE